MPKFGPNLETSPSFRSEWKLRLEIFLSTCWRIYSSVDKYFYRRRNWGSSEPKLTKLMAEAAESYLRYRGTLKTKHLARAVGRFWQAKNFCSSSNGQGNRLYRLYLEGYADKTSKRHLLESIRSIIKGQDARLTIIRRKFRPDVAYRVHGDFGLHAGLSLQIGSEDIGLIRRLARLIADHKESNSLAVEKFHVIDSQADKFTNRFLTNIIELLPLLEAISDEELANKICGDLEVLDASPQLYCSDQERAKLCLIARRALLKELISDGWKLLMLENPRWQQLEGVQDLLERYSSQESSIESETPHIPMGPPSMTVLENVTLTSGDVICSDQSLINIDLAANPAFSFVAGRQEVVVGTHANLWSAAVRVPKLQGKIVPEGILLASRADTNWFHWLIETLPKLSYLDAQVPRDIPVIISQLIPDTAKKSLELLTDRQVIEILPGDATRVDKLFVASPVLFHPDPVELHLNPATNTINTDALIWLRERILSKAKQYIGENRGSESVFFSRSSGARSIVNSRVVYVSLRKLGFVVHDPGQMSFMEQVVAFHSAKRIVLVGGAAMANLIFCSPGTAVVALGSQFTVGYKMPEILAGLAGSKVMAVSGRPVGNFVRSSYLEKIHAHYYVGIDALSKAVKRLQ